MKTSNQVLPPAQFDRSGSLRSTPVALTQPGSAPQATANAEVPPTAQLEALQTQIQDTLQLGSEAPESASRSIAQLNEALQSLKQVTHSGANASVLSVLQRFQSDTLPKNIDTLKANQSQLQQQIGTLPSSALDRQNLELQLQLVSSSLEVYQQASRLLAASPLLQAVSASPQEVKPVSDSSDTADALADTAEQLVDTAKNLAQTAGSLIDKAKDLADNIEVPGILKTALRNYQAEKEAEEQAITELTNLSPDQVTPANFTHLSELVATYNKSTSTTKPPLSQDLLNNLETLFLNEASQQEPAEQMRLLSMLPGIDANDLLLVKARGSLGMLGQLKASQSDLSQLPEALQQTLVNQLNQTLKMSGASLRVDGLEDDKANQAVQELEKQLGLPVTGEVTVENLREIEKTQKNLYVMISNSRNILHDEILSEGANKAQTLESLVGKGEAINQKEALNHIQVLRQKYFWLTDKQIPADKLSPELYFDTMKARQSWLNESRELMGQSQLFLVKEASLVQAVLEKQGGTASFSQLQAMANDENNFTLRERAALQKLVKNSNVYDFVWSSEVSDQNKDGKIDQALVPPDRTRTTLTVNQLKQFKRAIILDTVILSTGKKSSGINIPEFYDGRQAAAKIYDASKVSGDEWFSWTNMGMGSNESVIKSTLQNSQEARGKLIALKRDYERMYQTELKEDINGELSGGELGENLAYLNSSGEDWIAQQQIGSAQRAELLLAKFKPQIDQIGADNGPIAWAVGHSSDDRARQQELLGFYAQAQQALSQSKANPNDKQAEKDLMSLTSKVLIRLQADQQADISYTQAKDQSIDVAKNVAVVAAATVATVATGGAGAPLLLAVAAGTAAGTAVAFTGEAYDQLGDYIGDSNRNAIATKVAQEQQQAVSQIRSGDDAFKTQILSELDATLKGLQVDQANRKVFDTDKLYNATYEGFKTSLVTSGMTAATMGLSQLGSSAKVQAAFSAMGKSGNLTRTALINGISGASGDVAGKIIAPLKLNNLSDPAKVEEITGQMEQHLAENEQLLSDLDAQKSSLQAQISAFNQKYQPVEPDADNTITQVQTVKLEPPSEEEVKALFTAQIQLQELEQNIADLSESNKQVKEDIQKIRQNAGSLLTWDSAEWDAISENLGRNMAISFVSGAALNMVGGKTMVTRVAANTGSSTVEAVGRNAIDIYVDGNVDKELFDGVVENVLTSLIAGEASNLIQNRQMAKMGLNSTAEGRLMQVLQKAGDGPATGNLQGLLKEAGFKAEAPETHGLAVAKVLQNHPEFKPFVNGNLHHQRIEMAKEFSQEIGKTIQKSHPEADVEKTVQRFWKAQEEIYLLEQKKQGLADTPDSPEKTTRLGELDSQQQGWKIVADDIVTGKQAYDAQGQILGDKQADSSDGPDKSPSSEKPDKTAVTEEADKPLPIENPVKTPVAEVDLPMTLEAMSRAKRIQDVVVARGGTPELVEAGHKKINDVLNEAASGITAEIKGEFFKRVEGALSDPKYQDKSVFEVMQKVVKDDPDLFTKKGEQISLADLKAEGTFSRAITMTAAYRDYMTDGTRNRLEREFGISNADEFAAYVKQDPNFFGMDLLDPKSMISGGNDTAWWSPKGQSSAETSADLAVELDVDPKRFDAGTIRVSIEPEVLYKLGLRKPTALDGMFKEWQAVDPGDAFGRTAKGGKAEGVIGGIPLNEMGTVEIFSHKGRIEVKKDG